MLVIEDYNDIKITKVKYYMVYFSYRGRRFFIRDEYEDNAYMSLYEKVLLPDGGMRVEELRSVVTLSNVSSLIKPKKGIKNQGYTYSQVDKKVFAMKLAKLGFIECNCIKKDLDEVNNKVAVINDKINKLEDVIYHLKEERKILLDFR